MEYEKESEADGQKVGELLQAVEEIEDDMSHLSRDHSPTPEESLNYSLNIMQGGVDDGPQIKRVSEEENNTGIEIEEKSKNIKQEEVAGTTPESVAVLPVIHVERHSKESTQSQPKSKGGKYTGKTQNRETKKGHPPNPSGRKKKQIIPLSHQQSKRREKVVEAEEVVIEKDISKMDDWGSVDSGPPTKDIVEKEGISSNEECKGMHTEDNATNITEGPITEGKKIPSTQEVEEVDTQSVNLKNVASTPPQPRREPPRVKEFPGSLRLDHAYQAERSPSPPSPVDSFLQPHPEKYSERIIHTYSLPRGLVSYKKLNKQSESEQFYHDRYSKENINLLLLEKRLSDVKEPHGLRGFKLRPKGEGALSVGGTGKIPIYKATQTQSPNKSPTGGIGGVGGLGGIGGITGNKGSDIGENTQIQKAKQFYHPNKGVRQLSKKGNEGAKLPPMGGTPNSISYQGHPPDFVLQNSLLKQKQKMLEQLMVKKDIIVEGRRDLTTAENNVEKNNLIIKMLLKEEETPAPTDTKGGPINVNTKAEGKGLPLMNKSEGMALERGKGADAYVLDEEFYSEHDVDILKSIFIYMYIEEEFGEQPDTNRFMNLISDMSATPTNVFQFII